MLRPRPSSATFSQSALSREQQGTIITLGLSLLTLTQCYSNFTGKASFNSHRQKSGLARSLFLDFCRGGLNEPYPDLARKQSPYMGSGESTYQVSNKNFPMTPGSILSQSQAFSNESNQSQSSIHVNIMVPGVTRNFFLGHLVYTYVPVTWSVITR